MIIQKYNIGDYKCTIYQLKLGYTFKIYYPLKGKNTCIGQSYCYYNDYNLCKESMETELKMVMNVVDTLF